MTTKSNSRIVFSIFTWILLLFPAAAHGEPLKLHPENPHYLLFRGKPTVLITSGEHYGAVLNGDFDYRKYLDELANKGLNLTRTFAGTYREIPSSFKIVENTLAPEPDKYICPWARSGVEGTRANGKKFDLDKFDEAYFARLKDFVSEAGRRGIVVELVLFSAIYDEPLWEVNPQNPANNVNNLGSFGRTDVYTFKNKSLTELQYKLVRKIVAELRDADNVYYEVCNEPYFGNVTKPWNDGIASAIVKAEAGRPGHLIAQNIANGTAKVESPNPQVAILNFHYATPPDSVGQNYHLARAIGDDETGFRGKEDVHYRTEAWDFLLAGGAIYSNLDYSFSAQHPDGSLVVTTSPGGGGAKLRNQLTILKRFMDEMNFIKMAPDNSVIVGGVPEKATARALAEPGRVFAIYVRGGSRTELVLKLPAGSFKAQWIDTQSGATTKGEEFDHGGGNKTLASSEYKEDIALRIRSK